MDFEELSTKNIALIVQNIEKEDDVHVYLGVLRTENNTCIFANEGQGYRVSINAEQLDRLKPVPVELKAMLLNADYYIPMTIQSLDNPEDDSFKKTGMNW